MAGRDEPGFEDDQLAADLREAFGFGTQMLLPATGSGAVPAEESAAAWEDHGFALFGERLGDFEVLDELGRGGMGVVYRARQVSLNREVALKVLPRYSGSGQHLVERFRTEAKAAARLHHTNIVPVYAHGEARGRVYYAMELVPGGSLEAAIRTRSRIISPSNLQLPPSPGGSSVGPRLPSEPPAAGDSSVADARELRRTAGDFRHIAGLVAEVADALEHAHRAGVIHRDIKPHNILIGRDEHLCLTDFGLARLTDEQHQTLTGEVMGTPAYLSPEQTRGDRGGIDHRTDVYSLGVTLYELLTLRRPFEGESREQIISGIRQIEPVAPQRFDTHIPRELQTICLKAMEKEPARRYQSAAALADDLRRYAAGRPILSRPPAPWTVALKWARRNRAATTALVAGVLVVALGAGLFAAVTGSRHKEAARLLDVAYEDLVYTDFHHPELAAGKLAEATRLGGDARRIETLQALCYIAEHKTQEGLAILEHLQVADPNDLEVIYLAAWARWRADQHEESQRLSAAADAAGGPRTAAEWFFRGLAAQFAQPEEAIGSYARARQLRAAENRFFPQATLHLARARNQIMYRTRTISAFAEAESALRELIDNGVYGAYPCYLLSISHRLAAEIYSGSPGTRPANAEYHYQQALHWARRGQELALPGDDGPLTAEAECLESSGDYAGALTARTAAIAAAADRPAYQWEGYHYRWRLYYWLGQYDAALADLQRLQEFDPENLFYRQMYPMFVHADCGRTEEAVACARALAARPPGADQTPAGNVVWAGTALRWLGRAAEADGLLTDLAGEVDFSAGLVPPQTAEWMSQLYAAAQGEVELDKLLEVAAEAHDPPKLAAEAFFHLAAREFGADRRAAAAALLEQSYRSFDAEKRYTYHAQLLRIRRWGTAPGPGSDGAEEP